MSETDSARFFLLILGWNAYRAGIPEPERYEQLRQDLYQVRNPEWNGNPPLSVWPAHLVDPDPAMMAAVEHYFLCRAWVGSGKVPAWEMVGLSQIYNAGKRLGLTPRHNPNNPTTPLTDLQMGAQMLGVRDGMEDLKKSGASAPAVVKPPTY